jgi:hypothetical protein
VEFECEEMDDSEEELVQDAEPCSTENKVMIGVISGSIINLYNVHQSGVGLYCDFPIFCFAFD